MNRRIRQFVAILFLVPLAFSATAQPARYIAGTHYIELSNPVRTQDPSKVEVVEAFWYGCTHCFRFEPLLENWVANLPDDVNFVLFPAQWNQLMKIHSQIYYVSEALLAAGKIDKAKFSELHEAAFNAINIDGNRLQNERQIGALFTEHGVSEEDFSSTFNSFSVRTKVNQGDRRMQDYQVRSTPNMIVNGKYLISTGQAVTTQQEMLNVVEFLIDRERQAMASTSGD
ncbi:MAG: thiol:disulfide interchange protein DsbA/DsbL [Gammaproteobacteria bacterium]|nr:thiol:disulfide interchange protein DsbA/DsbL [Pseudomonadales bacterium]MCP5347792.1 thiol:disulfide interchange protein DsbA/DsbL [Pseudomonadales bacterium]